MRNHVLFFFVVLLSCRTSSQKDSSPPLSPTNTVPNGNQTDVEAEKDKPGPSTPAPKPEPATKTEEFVGSCLRVKSNLPDEWLDCEQFYTGIEKIDYDRANLYVIQKRQCEGNQSIAASASWSDEECPSSEKHKICPNKTSWVNGVFGRRVFIRYQEAYKPADCG